MQRLGFVIAGAQKAGTSTLDAYLRRHPAIGMTREKETHVFDDETADWTRPDYDRLHAALPPGARLTGEATPITLYWWPAQYRLRAYNPDLKLILLFRDPIDRAFSNWRMVRGFSRAGVRVAGLPVEELPFSQAIRQGRERIFRHQEAPGLNRWWSYVERGLYGVQLDHFQKIFPKDQFLLLDFDDLATAPGATLERVARFLEIDAEGLSGVTLHENEADLTDADGLQAEDVEYLTSLYANDLRRFQDLSGLDVSRWRTARGLAL